MITRSYCKENGVCAALLCGDTASRSFPDKKTTETPESVSVVVSRHLVRLFGVQRETLESRNRQLFVLSFQVLIDRDFGIFYEFLLQQGELFVVFLQ